VQREDRRLGHIARKVHGDPNRWREIYRLNKMKKGQKIKAGDCFLLPEK